MKTILASLALSLAAFASVAQAAPVTTQVACDPSNISGAFACDGAFPGNELGNSSVLANTGSLFGNLYFANGGLDASPFTLVDQSDGTNGSQISFIYETGGALGSVLLNDPTGILNQTIFGIALKASNSYSLYLFDGGLLNQTGTMENLAPTWTSLGFTTAGTSVNGRGIPQGLSHASLWQGPLSPNFGGGCTLDPSLCEPTTQIPEPGTLALMGLGLLGVAVVKRRKA